MSGSHARSRSPRKDMKDLKQICMAQCAKEARKEAPEEEPPRKKAKLGKTDTPEEEPHSKGAPKKTTPEEEPFSKKGQKKGTRGLPKNSGAVVRKITENVMEDFENHMRAVIEKQLKMGRPLQYVKNVQRSCIAAIKEFTEAGAVFPTFGNGRTFSASPTWCRAFLKRSGYVSFCLAPSS